MNANGNKRRRSKTSSSKKDAGINSQSVRIMLTQGERDLLLKACMKYRYTIPAYIQSKQAEAEALEAIIARLS